MPDRLLVIGAKPGSLGHAIVGEAVPEWDVYPAGVSGEPYYVDVRMPHTFRTFIDQHGVPDCIICTAGINRSGSILADACDALIEQFVINTVGPVSILREWLATLSGTGQVSNLPNLYGYHFVGISSNSAHIARSQSLGYCASKAALSMALRCAAREVAHTGIAIYGYEPGWLDRTPMSEEVADRMSVGAKRHRIPSGDPIDPERLAHTIVRNLTDNTGNLNGCMIRIDGGEQ